MTISVSYLNHIFTDASTGLRKLHQNKISRWADFLTWDAFVCDFLETCVYPTPQAHKYETYGFCPTIFEEGFNRPKQGKEPQWGHWRIGDHAADTVSLLTLDLDNANEDQPTVTIDEFEAHLSAMGVNYILYTTFSHTASKHKVRAIIQPERDLTLPEAYDAYRAFDANLNGQLDGTIYDPGDYIYGPPFNAHIRVNLDGRPLKLSEARTGLPMPEVRQGARKIATPAQRAQTAAMSHDLSARPEVSITNEDICPPEYLSRMTVLAKDRSHSQTLMSVLSSLWLRSGATLTIGEMRNLAADLDAIHAGYVRRKYGQDEIERMIDSVMDLPAEERRKDPDAILRQSLNILKKAKNNGKY